ncbi:hypothetical protein AB0L50_29815 [Streptomyces flaveolus]|uniref:hypothetical protein n=1 Tax=Streptomyces flaveolus TaxID=67297 RepID=UPI00342EED8B
MLNPEQAAAILDWMRRRPRGGRRLHAFFATLCYCGPRPEEAVAMRVEDVTLPEPDAEDQWCELLIHVPGRPALAVLRQHIEDERLRPGDLLFLGEAGGILAGSVIRRAWRSAQVAERRHPARSGGGVGR